MTFEEYIIKERSVYYFLHLTKQDMIKCGATSLEKWLSNTYLEYAILKEYL